MMRGLLDLFRTCSFLPQVEKVKRSATVEGWRSMEMLLRVPTEYCICLVWWRTSRLQWPQTWKTSGLTIAHHWMSQHPPHVFHWNRSLGTWPAETNSQTTWVGALNHHGIGATAIYPFIAFKVGIAPFVWSMTEVSMFGGSKNISPFDSTKTLDWCFLCT